MIHRILRFAEQSADLLTGLRAYPEPAPGQRPTVIAHRGAWDLEGCRENTMAAFLEARDLGVGGIEFDVHFTRDQVPVVHHDPGFGRIFAYAGLIQEMTFAEVQAVSPQIPRLSEVLALTDLHFMIEIKVAMTPGQLATLAEMLRGKTPKRDYHLLTIDPVLVREHQGTPAEAWVLVGEIDLRSRVNLSLERGLGGVAGHYLGMTSSMIARLHDRGQIAGVGFVPNANLYRREWGRGVDFVFTNTAGALIRP